MKSKKILMVLAAAVLALSLAACGKKAGGAGENTDETYEEGAYGEDGYGQEDYEEEDYEEEDGQAGEEQLLMQERHPKSLQELAADKPGLLDAARFDGFQADQDSLFQEFTFPFNRFGELDTEHAFTFRSDGTYYLERCYFGREHDIGSLHLGIYNDKGDEALHRIVFEVAIELNGSYEEGVDLAEEYEDYDDLEMLDDELFYEADEEDNWYTLYKVVGSSSAAGKADQADAAAAEEALRELEDMGIDSEELMEEAAELARAEEEAGNSASDRKKLDIARYEGTDVVEIAMRGSSGEAYDLEQVKEVLLSIADCITEDNGAPFLQDLVCVKDFNGFSVKDPALLSNLYVTFNAEENRFDYHVKLMKSMGDNRDEIGVLNLYSEAYYDQGRRYETMEVLGREFCSYGEEYGEPQLFSAGEGTISRIDPGPDDRQNLKELTEEYLQFD